MVAWHGKSLVRRASKAFVSYDPVQNVLSMGVLNGEIGAHLTTSNQFLDEIDMSKTESYVEGCLQNLSRILIIESRFGTTRMTSKSLVNAAICRGVRPYSSVIHGSAPPTRRVFTRLGCLETTYPGRAVSYFPRENLDLPQH